MEIIGRQPDLLEPKQQEEAGMRQFLVVQLASGLYAFAAKNVAHVALPMTPMAVPTAPAFILGILHVQGRFVAAVDFQQWLQVAAPESDNAANAKDIHDENTSRLIIIEGAQTAIAIFVDAVIGLYSVAPSTIRASAGTDLGNTTNQLHGREGVFDSPEGPTTILNADEILASLTAKHKANNSSWGELDVRER